MREEEKLLSGILFSPGMPELRAIKRIAHNLNNDYNATYEDETEKRAEILEQLLGEMGEGTFMQGPIYFHYGKHTKIGKRVFINFNFTVQDDALVTIGDDCNFGPNVTIVTPVHPLLACDRNMRPDGKGGTFDYEYARPITIEDNVWLASNVTVCGGVTIGHDTVIGAGSVVTKDVPPYTIVGGVPARPIRRRFSEEETQALLRLKWWDFPPDRIQKCIKTIQSGNLNALKNLI